MIVSLRGEIIELSLDYLVLDVNGIGYECFISQNTYDKISQGEEKTININIHHQINESGQYLFGFFEKEEKKIFRLLISRKFPGIFSVKTRNITA